MLCDTSVDPISELELLERVWFFTAAATAMRVWEFHMTWLHSPFLSSYHFLIFVLLQTKTGSFYKGVKGHSLELTGIQWTWTLQSLNQRQNPAGLLMWSRMAWWWWCRWFLMCKSTSAWWFGSPLNWTNQARTASHEIINV